MASASNSPSGTPPKLNLPFLEDPEGQWSNPPEDQVTRWIRDLRCLSIGHGPCAAGCRDTLPGLTSADFLTPAVGAEGPNVHFTADLVWALAHAQHRGVRIDWQKLDETLTRFCNTQLPDLSLQHLRDSAKEAFERLARHHPQYRPTESLDSQEGVLDYPHGQNGGEVESPAPPPTSTPAAVSGPRRTAPKWGARTRRACMTPTMPGRTRPSYPHSPS